MELGPEELREQNPCLETGLGKGTEGRHSCGGGPAWRPLREEPSEKVGAGGTGPPGGVRPCPGRRGVTAGL